MDDQVSSLLAGLWKKYPCPIKDRAMSMGECIVICADAESYYDNDYSLSRMTTEAYIRDSRFECIMWTVKVGNLPIQLVTGTMHEIALWFSKVPWHRTLFYAHNCLLPDVEVLTPLGWKRIDQVTTADTVMQWDSNRDELTWCNPTAVVNDPYDGEMLQWNSQYHRTAYTPNHRMYTGVGNCTEHSPWEARSAAEVAGMGPNNVVIPVSSTFVEGEGADFTNDELRLLEAARADSNFAKDRTGAVSGVRFKFKKQRKIERLTALLRALNQPYALKVDAVGATSIALYKSALRDKIIDFLGAEKIYSRKVFSLSTAQREVILDEAQYWDGSIPPDARENSYHVSTVDAVTVDWLQIMAHTTNRCFAGTWRQNKRGFSGSNGRDLYSGTVRPSKNAKLVCRPDRIHHKGTVHCLTVPTGAFMIRSNGRVHITGNSAFDASILSYRWGFIPRFILCTARMAAPFFSNICGVSLKSLAEHFQLPAKGTAVHDMKGKRRLDLTPKEFDEYASYCAHDTWLCEQLFWQLLPKLPEHELYSLHATLMMTVHPTLRLDTQTLETMLADEHEHRETLYQRTIDLLGVSMPVPVIKSVLSSNDKFPQLLQALGVEVGTKLNAKGETKFALAKTDPAMDEMLHCDDVLVRTLCEARLQAKSTQAESRAQRFLEIASRGPMPFPLLWCGADVTGRWSATDSINVQNMKRGGALRAAIHAPEGFKIIVADLSQIELRGGWWLAGEHDKLHAFASGHDPYKQIMCDTFGMDYDSIDKKSQDRQCGKVIQLSGIYGTGHEKARHTVRIQAGKTITLGDSKQLIDTYRRNHQHVVGAWAVGGQAIEALYADQNMPLWQPGFEIVSSRDAPFGVAGIRKPDGMFLTRPGVGFQWGTWPSGERKKEWFYNRRKGKNIVRDYIYGGKMFQAATQSLSRDILSAALARIIKQLPYGCYVAGTVHDEFVAVAPDEHVEFVRELMRREMTVAPWWAPDLPLAVDIDVGDCYGSIK